MVIATKGGIHWDEAGNRQFDASPDRLLRRQCDESLQRLGTDYVDLLYLHAPDPNVPLTESAGALKSLLDAGKTRSVGVSNLNLAQIETFHTFCPIAAIQPPYNMLQREIEDDIVPWCLQHGVSIIVYWPLMKGLLAGKLARDHQFLEGDGRAKYPMFQGEEWNKNQDFIDELRGIADDLGKTVAQLVVNWTVHQIGITAALCGAKRAYQIEETAGARSAGVSTSRRCSAFSKRSIVAANRFPSRRSDPPNTALTFGGPFPRHKRGPGPFIRYSHHRRSAAPAEGQLQGRSADHLGNFLS